MPDGDVVYHGVGQNYATAYKELCEGYFSDEHIAASIARALRRSLKRYGNQPVVLISQTCDEVTRALGRGMVIDYHQESLLIDENSRDLMGHRRGMSLAMDVCKRYVLDTLSRTARDAVLKDVIKSYISRALLVDFSERLPLVNHYNEVDPRVVEERLERLRPHLDVEIDSIADHIVRTGKVDRLKRPSRARTSRPPDFENMDVSNPDGTQEVDHVSSMRA